MTVLRTKREQAGKGGGERLNACGMPAAGEAPKSRYALEDAGTDRFVGVDSLRQSSLNLDEEDRLIE